MSLASTAAPFAAANNLLPEERALISDL